MPNDAPSLNQLSTHSLYETELKEALSTQQNVEMNVLIASHHCNFFPEHLAFPKKMHEYAIKALGTSYRKLVLQPFEKEIIQRQTTCIGKSDEDLASERLTKLAFKELEGFKSLYWLARANDLSTIVSFIETEKKDCRMLFSVETRNAVVSKLAGLGDQENIDRLLNLVSDASDDRRSMLTAVINGACQGGQTAILNNLFEEKCQTEEDKTHCQNYLTEEVSSLLSKACAIGNLDSVEFILERQPETEHQKIISEVEQGYRYHALSEACRGGNPDVVNRLLKPFSQEEIDSIFLPSYEETNNIPLPFHYANVLTYSSVELNQHILTKIVSPECREKIVTSKIFVESLAQVYGNQDEKRSSGLLSQVPQQQFELVRQAVMLELNNKKGQEDVKQRFEKDCEGLKNYSSVSDSRLIRRSPFSSEACSSSNTGNISVGNRLQNSVFFSQSLAPEVDETERQKDKRAVKRAV